MFMHRVNISRAHAEVRAFGSGVSWWEMLYFVAGGIVRHDVYSWGQINPQRTTHQIDRICGAREYCAVVTALSICVC
jgi:hypothetical protein